MSIETILLAADYLDRREREAEHGYATTLPCPIPGARPDRRKAFKVKHQIQGIRSSHNELEKNRRAHMKHCLEQLKALIPLSGDASRHTTLGLLINAAAMIKSLRVTEQQQKSLKDQLVREQQCLTWRMEQLLKKGTVMIGGGAGAQYRAGGQYRVRQSVSESSTASTESSSSSISSELDDIDVTGSGLSDFDDHSSDATGDICGITYETLIIRSL